jgi:hypothetical protein
MHGKEFTIGLLANHIIFKARGEYPLEKVPRSGTLLAAKLKIIPFPRPKGVKNTLSQTTFTKKNEKHTHSQTTFIKETLSQHIEKFRPSNHVLFIGNHFH